VPVHLKASEGGCDLSEDKENKQNTWNPGMGSDSQPQPHYDSDFGPDMGYEEGERDDKTELADKIREDWRKREEEEKSAASKTRRT
jgi:hypothetical protein